MPQGGRRGDRFGSGQSAVVLGVVGAADDPDVDTAAPERGNEVVDVTPDASALGRDGGGVEQYSHARGSRKADGWLLARI
jgi:hypothetical protein